MRWSLRLDYDDTGPPARPWRSLVRLALVLVIVAGIVAVILIRAAN